MTYDVEHLLYAYYTIYISSLENYVFISFAHLKIGLFVILLLTYKISLYIMDTRPLPDISDDLQIFSHILCIIISLS